ncbi:tripartite-type tricarboxylate transporter receptor subunit TctC [Rhodoferax saidenbachensis]|uniref:Tripartite-type tricarboxylate transporter receptor subunit TctC n=2 Tax=Rhodoferax saidenbachensis TaxID=1484693 RepID=A0ABU1ZKW3_9BURK|nr:tripartite-type tricarboxylate transporter receptor subunit TctC [Rhodoferax saidenbachensis]
MNQLLSSVLAAVLAGVLGATPVLADTFPSKPIRLVVPFGAGGVADLTARTVAQKMSESLGQPIVVDNKPGAGGVVAGDAVAKAEPDGYTLLLMSNGTAVSAGLFKSLPFDAVRDFAPISTMGYFDLAVLASPNAPYKTMADLLAYAKANPGKLNVGTVNIGSTQNLAAELLKTRAGVDFLVVPFNGTPALTTALRGGQIDVAVEILGPMMGQVQSKAIRALAVLSDTRASQLPDVPTLMQSGVKDFDVSSWNALAAPAKTPKDVIARLNKEVQAAVNSPDVKKKLYELNVEARGSTPEKLGELLASEIKRWSDVIAKANVPKL